jgi:hypothetical protein
MGSASDGRIFLFVLFLHHLTENVYLKTSVVLGL